MLTGAIIRELDSESSEFKKGVSAVFIEDGAGVPEDESAVIDEGGDDTTHTTFFDSENSESTENRNRSSSATNQADIDDLFTDRPPTWITKGGSTTSTPLVEEESTSNPTDITSNIPSVVVEGTPASEIGAEVEAKSSAPILAVETEA